MSLNYQVRFCLPPGENEESCLILTLFEVQQHMCQRLNVQIKDIDAVCRELNLNIIDGDKNKYDFRLYENGVAYDLEVFLLECIIKRDRKCLGGENEEIFRRIEAINYIAFILKSRLDELVNLDREFTEPKTDFEEVASNLRKIHTRIINSSFNVFGKQIQGMKTTISANRQLPL